MRGAHVLGVRIDRLTTARMLEMVDQFVKTGRPRHIAYVNTESVNQASRDRRYRSILREADMVYADGMGVVWASRLFDEPLPERVNLGDCLPQLCQLCEQRGYRLFLLGGEDGVARRTAERLRAEFPGLQIAGTHAGYFPPEHNERVVAQIRQAGPHVLLVGMGAPKQEKWIWRHRDRLDVPVLWGVGALFDYYGGKTPRAPVWMRRVGLEWLFRLLVEPQRLWRRYLLGNAVFLLRLCSALLTDAALVTASWLGAYGIWRWLDQPFGFTLNAIDPYLKAVGLMVAIWLVTCASFGLYRRSPNRSLIAELAQVARATWVGLFATMAVAFLLREFSFGRPVVVLSGLLTFASLTASRLLSRQIERRGARRKIGLRRALLVGTGSLAQRLRAELEDSPVGYDVVGFAHEGAGRAGTSVDPDKILGSMQALGELIADYRVQDVFVASESLRLHQKLNLLAAQERWGVDFHVVSVELESFAKRVRIGRLGEVPLLDLPRVRSSRWYEAGKRLLDVVVAAVGLVACAPLGLWIAWTITRESPGPVFFSQQRVGRGGRLFRLHKFRTMVAHAPAYGIAPNELHDPRVTRFGQFLRRWSLDELPQLVSILMGTMSLVGPRPEMPFIVQQYQPWERRRLAVKPGLTGLWQVVGRKELPLHRHLEYDLYYVRHRGWLLDLMILARTIPAVISRRGAF